MSNGLLGVCSSGGGQGLGPPNMALILGSWSGEGGCLTEDPQRDPHIGSSNTKQIQKTTLFQGPGYLKLFTLIQNHVVGLHPTQLSGEKSPSVQLPRA